MRVINVTPKMDALLLGKQGENKSTKFLFDVSGWLEDYPGCTITLVHRRPHESSSYPCVLTTEEDGRRSWVINSADLAKDGDGQAELKCTLGDVIEKDKRTWKTKIGKSLSGDGDAPEPWESLMDDIEDLVGDAQDAAEDAEDAATAAATSEANAADSETAAAGSATAAAGSATEAAASAAEAAAAAEALIDDTAGDGDTDKTWSADKLHDEFNGKANKYNTVLTSTLSRGRREGSSVGKGSYAFGNSVVASGENSHAEGLMSEASGENSHAEGHGTHATNARTHAEGYSTYANGANAHSEGYATQANGPHSHAEGSNTTASHKSQHVFGEFNIADDSSASATNRGNYVEIVGNGTGPNTKSNARTLDWDGNEELAGDLTIKKGTANEVKVSELYKKPATGIPASDLEDGVIPDPEDLIDDTAGEGDTDKVWSADKSHSLLTQINSRPETKNTTESDSDIDVTDENGNVIVRFAHGDVQTKNFNSSKIAGIKLTTDISADFDLVDMMGNVLARFSGGHILTKNFDSSNIVANGYLKGKVIVNFGDSIFGNKRPPKDISTTIANETGATVYNCGFGGCRMAKHDSSRLSTWGKFSMWELADAIASNDFTGQESAIENFPVSEMPSYFPETLALLESIDFSTVDIVTIAYGTNDFTASVLVDDENDKYSTSTFAGALRYSIETLLGAFPNLRIVCCGQCYRWWDNGGVFVDDSNTHEVGGQLLTQFVSKTEDVAKEYNLQFINNYDIGIGKFTRSYFFTGTDTTHPNDIGTKLIARHIVRELY